VENYEFVKYAIDHNIHLMCLPSHSTHILQPLDVGIFGPLSTYYKQELQDHVHQQGPHGTIKKGDILPMLQRVRIKTFKPETIRSAWRASGLISFNRNRILRDPIFQAKMVPKTPWATRRPGLQPSTDRVVGAPEVDRIELSSQQIEENPANEALKDLLTRCIKEARIIDAARVIAEEGVDKVRQVVKPAKTDRRQLRGGLLLSSKHLAKLYQKRMELDKKKVEAPAKCKETKALVQRKAQSKTNTRKMIQQDEGEEVNTSSSDDKESESISDEEMVDSQPYQVTYKISLLFSYFSLLVKLTTCLQQSSNPHTTSRQLRPRTTSTCPKK